MNNEKLGPAERIIQTLLTHSDHLVHNRPGVVVPDASSATGVRWHHCTWKQEGAEQVVYLKLKSGKKATVSRFGVLTVDRKNVIDNGARLGRYMAPGIFPEVAVWMYRQVAAIWKADNEFVARWASYAFTQDHRDLKVVLAAFLLVQSRKGEPVLEGDKVAFHDEDFRDVGEAMLLLDGKSYLDLKMLLRIRDLLALPQIAAVNRELGFTISARNPFFGRYVAAATKWLRYREENPKLLNGLVKSGFRSSLIRLSKVIGYKPVTAKFFATLRWKQAQAKDGRRSIAIGQAIAAAESWAALTEAQICERIMAERPNFKRIIGLLPHNVGLTRAVMAAAVEAGSLSTKDLVIYTPTLEELGLLTVPGVQARWHAAVKGAEDQRASNIAARVRSDATKAALQEAAEAAAHKAVAEVARNLRIYVFVDISGSMEGAIEQAKAYIAKLLPAFSLERLHVATFNTFGKEVAIRHASSAGVENAFRGVSAGGGTDYGAGVKALVNYRPQNEEDTLFIFIGDENAQNFAMAVRQSGLAPLAFGLIPVQSRQYGRGQCVRLTASELGVPCFEIDQRTFGDDPYAIPRTLRALIAATPVNHARATAPRVSLIDAIAKTELLRKPLWAA